MTFEEPTGFAEAVEKLRRRGVLPTSLGTQDLRALPLEIRERAFFSAHVENARLLQAMKDFLLDWIEENRDETHGGLKAGGRAAFVARMREIAIEEGLGRIDPETGEIDPEIREHDLQDIRSIRRLQLIFDTVTEQAQEYGYWLQGQDENLLWVYPAARFIRVRPVMVPRPYHEAHEGEVHRKDDLEFWLDMNRDFGVPWGPWGFGSGMGTEDVDREEAEELGVIGPDEKVRPLTREFNDKMSFSTAGLEAEILAALRRLTGGRVGAEGRLRVGGEAAETSSEMERAFPRRQRLSGPAVETALKKLAKGDGRTLLDKARIEMPAGSAEAVRPTIANLGAMLPPKLVAKLPRIRIVLDSHENMNGIAGGFDPQASRMRINERLLDDPAELAKTVIHEAAHWLWPHLPAAARRRVVDHFNRRIVDDTPFIRNGRRYWRDRWAHELAGLEGGEEVIPYHLEMLGLPPEVLAQRLQDEALRETLELVLEALGIV